MCWKSIFVVQLFVCAALYTVTGNKPSEFPKFHLFQSIRDIICKYTVCNFCMAFVLPYFNFEKLTYYWHLIESCAWPLQLCGWPLVPFESQSDLPQHEKNLTFYKYWECRFSSVQCCLHPRWERTHTLSWISHIFFPLVMHCIHVRNQIFWKFYSGSEFCFGKCGLSIELSHVWLWAFCYHRKFK
jgi:hypothetical protein